MLLVGLIGTFALMAAGASQAAVVTHDNNLPISFGFVSPCNGDTGTLTGTVDDFIRITTSNSGRVDMGEHLALDVSGVGAPSGTEYSAHQVLDTQDNNTTVVNGAVVSTEVGTIHLIGQGNTPNFVVHLVAHETITPDGTITSLKIDQTEECQG
jgi:hypothetical protein